MAQTVLAAAPQVPPSAPSPSTAVTIAGYEACQTTDEAAFRSAIETVTVKALRTGVSGLDYRAAVGDEWRRLDVGRMIDAEVDKAVTAVSNETSWGALLQSLGNQDKARELTVAVAERVYRSDAMKSAIEDLAVGVGRNLGARIELATSEAAGPALDCARAFLGPRYGATVAQVVTGQAQDEFKLGPAGSADVSPGAVLRQSGQGIAGAAILVMRRQMANMAQRIGARLVGSILSRLVSVVAGGVGIVLIAKDVWELRNGVLPIIAGEMKSEDSKKVVQDELAKTMAEQIDVHMAEIGALSAQRIVDIWREYRAAHAKVLELAERQSSFRDFLDRARPEFLPRIDEITALILGAEGEDGVMKRLADGSLDEAVNRLPDPALDIARQSRSVDTALAWNAVAGDRIGAVVEHELFRRAKPGDYTRDSLTRVLDLGDPLAIRRMAVVPPAARDVLFELDAATLTAAARGLDEQQLASLAQYMTGLNREPREAILNAVAKAPGNLQVLASPRVRDAVLSSADQAAAVSMMLRPAPEDTVSAIRTDLELTWAGKIAPELIWHKHPVVVVLIGLAAAVLLLLLRRLFRGGRRSGPPAPQPTA